MKKRIGLLLVICLVLVSGLSACGKDSNKETEGNISKSNISGEITVLTFEYAEDNQYIDTLNQLKDEFEQTHEGVTVKYENFPYGEYENQLRLSLASGQPADIVWIDAPYIASYASSGALTA